MRFRGELPHALLMLAILLGTTPCASTALAQDPPAGSESSDFDRIEEDWELVVANPDPVVVGPQVTTCVNPFGLAASPFVTFNLNYRERPSFQAGGMQVQVWSRAGTLCFTSSDGGALFSVKDETVTWTQRLRLFEGYFFYDIENGESITWGRFGQSRPLLVWYPTEATSFKGYDPAESASKSGVSWQSNGVTRLVLKRVRYYWKGTLVKTDETPRTVVENGSGEAS